MHKGESSMAGGVSLPPEKDIEKPDLVKHGSFCLVTGNRNALFVHFSLWLGHICHEIHTFNHGLDCYCLAAVGLLHFSVQSLQKMTVCMQNMDNS